MHTRRTSRNLKVCHRVAFVFLLLFTLLAASSQSLAGNRMYDASWIAESFGNDNVNIGTGNSRYFEVYAVPWGNQGHSLNPLCDISSTPVTTAGVGTAWAPRGPGWPAAHGWRNAPPREVWDAHTPRRFMPRRTALSVF